MATTNLGKVSVTPKGEYDPFVTYERLDVISHNGSSYIVKQASTGVTPIEGEFYALIAEKGDGGSFVKKAYKTYAAMDADKVNIPANSSVDVTNDLDESKNGAYIYDGVAFTRSQYDSKVVTDKIIADTAIAVQDAINNTAVEGGVLADTFVTATANGTLVARSERARRIEHVTPFDFGVIADGVVDDTESLRAYHAHCNLYNIDADYRGIGTIAVKANARIIINTNVDFKGSKFKILNGIIAGATPAEVRAVDFQRVFLVEDALCPRVTFTNDLDSFYSKRGSYRPAHHITGLWSGNGFVQITSNSTKLPARYPTAAGQFRPYVETFFCANDTSKYPVTKTMQITAAVTTIRENSPRGHITIKNPTIIEDSDWNRQNLITVQRNQVTIQNLSVDTVSRFSNNEVNLSGLLIQAYCSEFTFDGYTGTGIIPYRDPVTNGAEGVYLFTPIGGAETYIKNIHVPPSGAWGWMGGNFMSGVYTENCSMDRFDVHDGGYNMYFNKVAFNKFGIQLGSGGGILSIDNCIVNDSSLIFSLGNSYGGCFDGDIVINNITWTRNKASGENPLIRLTDTGSLFDWQGEKLQLFRNLTIDGLIITDAIWEKDISIVNITKSTVDKIIAPYSLTIRNVIAQDWHKLSISLGIGTMLRPTAEEGRYSIKNQTKVNLSNINAGKVFLHTNNQRTSDAIQLLGDFHDINCAERLDGFEMYSACQWVRLKYTNITNVKDLRIETERGVSEIIVNNCTFAHNTGTLKSIGQLVADGSNNADRLGFDTLRISNCHFAAGPYRMWGASSLIGNTFGTTTHNLPTGCTIKDAFYGWSYHEPKAV